MKNNDNQRLHRKKQYSRMVISNAFLELLQKQPLNKITVKAVCDLADVNRTTFYGNFYDLYDVLEQIQNELYERIETSVKKSGYSNESFYEIFEIVKENKRLCKVLFSDNNAQDFIHKVMMFPYSHMINEWRPKANISEERLAYLFEFCANGCVAFLKKWVTEDTKIPTKEATELLQAIIASNLENFIGK